MAPSPAAPRDLDARAIAMVLLLSALWVKTYRPSALAAFSLTTPLFGVLATALVIGEPIGWRLAASALLVAGGIAVATLLRDRAVVARAPAPRPVPGATR
jgi:drug/metabolite transporter (DMT)-like permease